MPELPTTPPGVHDRVTAARSEARRAALVLARDSGAQIITRPAFRGGPAMREVEPLAGARAARDLELAARRAARNYIRQAREAGHEWDHIGRALGRALGRAPDTDASHAGTTLADAAWTYATGGPPVGSSSRRDRSFTWTCRACDQPVTDHGPVAGPADNEHGHAERCPRLAAAVAEWNAGWEAEP